MMLFFADVRVKENRRTLLCKKAAAPRKSARLKSRLQRRLHMGRRRRRYKIQKGGWRHKIAGTSKSTGLKTGHYTTGVVSGWDRMAEREIGGDP
jgi:hypothetical protein